VRSGQLSSELFLSRSRQPCTGLEVVGGALVSCSGSVGWVPYPAFPAGDKRVFAKTIVQESVCESAIRADMSRSRIESRAPLPENLISFSCIDFY